ncbi:hypothetical protein N7495_006758 [Penicillium taxi]|uniref:uncharacterized protein n=1 Tax=Penicillium taxi TaxID=168475 RepID=UPI0025454B13|nr:uncharacterized protein N7495_006758 [Penicillium taxi]KAJ5895067.1 hypothetical protein N7495_006758 [Penicillium taxi]
MALKEAYIHMRYTHSVISHTTKWDDYGFPWIQHQVFSGKCELEAWVSGIIKVEVSSRQAYELRDESKKRCAVDNKGNARAFATHLAAPVDSMTDLLDTKHVQFLFHANHIHFDGMGFRKFVGDLLRVLAEVVSGNITPCQHNETSRPCCHICHRSET